VSSSKERENPVSLKNNLKTPSSPSISNTNETDKVTVHLLLLTTLFYSRVVFYMADLFPVPGHYGPFIQVIPMNIYYFKTQFLMCP
jgi:hypothetical protein